MKIAIVAHSALGGSVYFAVSLARQLALRGHGTWLLAPGQLPYQAVVDAAPGLEYREIPAPLVGADGIPEDASPFISLVMELHAAERLDVINVHYVVPWLAYLVPLRAEMGVPIIGTFHGTDLYPTEEMAPLQQATLAVARQADALSVVCRCGLDELEPGAVCIPNFTFDRAPSEPPPRNPQLLLHISNFRPVKNVHFLLHAFAAYVDRYPEPGPRLDLIGEGPEKGVAKELVDSLGLADRVSFLPPVLDRDELMREIAASGAVVLTSHRECCPLVFLEAMTCGTLCMGSRVGGIPDLLEGGRGELYEPGDVDSFVTVLNRCAADPAHVGAMTGRASEYVATELTADAIAARYEAMYERVATTAGSARGTG